MHSSTCKRGKCTTSGRWPRSALRLLCRALLIDVDPILSVRNLSTGYGKKQVLWDVSLEVMPGEMLLIAGGNGSGKSTLFKAIYGLLPPWNTDAEIIFRPDPNGPALKAHPAALNLSKGLAYLPQKKAVFDDLTVEDNLRLAGHTLCSHNEFIARQDAVLASIPALKTFLRQKPEKMSGGERQMTALGMVLLHQPRLLLLDEPLAGLDSDNAHLLATIIQGIRERLGLALVIIEHRFTEFARMAHRTMRLQLGAIAEYKGQQGRPGIGPALELT